ncbi:Tyrosine recombinase XerC [Ferriphaselus amnicola]|uniref:Tyrosine recombinase XerC n=1 Tax=Ferriphaselus amnicola TaxID=1188319 RepID=A0A2Z6GCZ6_9PROT|nr:site-specific integrase [Ferriphaselus amnicola]BBE51199.1 Tyrosine recombinase XerC [Ferriphaselus amnicola]
MQFNKLTQQIINKGLFTPPGKSRVELCDEEVRGMYIEVRSTSNGQGSYYVRYKDSTNKTCHQRIGRTADMPLVEARKQAKALKAEIALGADPRGEIKSKRAIPTLNAFFHETYLPYAKVHKRSWQRDVQLFVRIDKEFGQLRLDQVQKQKVAVFHAGLMSEEGLSAASADHHPKLLRRMLSMAMEYELIDSNPMSRFKLFNHDNKVENYLTDEQLVRLMEVLRADANRTVCNIAILLLGTGCRLNEILSAKKSDIDIQNRVLKIAASTSKSKRVRSVPLNDASIDIILKQMEDTQGYDYLFINHQTGKPYVSIKKVWERLRNKAGLPHLRVHDLRHSFASFLVNSGRTLYEVQQILGHSQSIVTERYAHLSSKTLQDAANSASLRIMRAKPVLAVEAPAIESTAQEMIEVQQAA